MTVLLANNVSTTLAADITASSVSLTVADGNRFPTLTSGQYFYATLIASTGALEIVKVASRVGNVFSIVRAQEGTQAQAFSSGTRIDMRVTAQSIYDAVDDGAAQVVIDITTELDALQAEDVAINGRIDAIDARTDALEAFDTTLGTSAGSNSVGFLQSGTGATARTVQGKLRDVVSVKDFGAVGDGVTDDTTAFQNAALASKSIFVPKGNYLVNNCNWSASTVGDNLEIVFDKNAVCFASNNSTDIFNLTAQRRCYFTGGQFTKGQKAFNLGVGNNTVAYCKFINQSFGGGAASSLIYGYWSDTAVSNVWQNCTFGKDSAPDSIENGVYFNCGSAQQTNVNAILDCEFIEVKYYGVYFGNTNANDNRIIGGLFEEVHKSAIFSGQSNSGLYVNGAFFEDCGTSSDYPIYVDSNSGIQIANNTFRDNQYEAAGWAYILSGTGANITNNNSTVVFSAAKTISGATQANPVEVTCVGHGLTNGNRVLIKNVSGMTQLNDNVYRIVKISNDVFTLYFDDGNTVNGTGYTAYVSGGAAYKITPLVVASNLSNPINVSENTLLNIAKPSLVIPYVDGLFHCYTNNIEYLISYTTQGNSSVFTFDNVNTAVSPYGYLVSDGFAEMRVPSTSLAAQDTWYTIGKLVFPNTSTARVSCIVETTIGGSSGGALFGDSLLAKRFVWRDTAGVFTVLTIGTDFETTGTPPSAGTSAYAVQIVVDSVYNYLAYIQVKRTSGGATATFIGPRITMQQSDVNAVTNRVNLVPA